MESRYRELAWASYELGLQDLARQCLEICCALVGNAGHWKLHSVMFLCININIVIESLYIYNDIMIYSIYIYIVYTQI